MTHSCLALSKPVNRVNSERIRRPRILSFACNSTCSIRTRATPKERKNVWEFELRCFIEREELWLLILIQLIPKADRVWEKSCQSCTFTHSEEMLDLDSKHSLKAWRVCCLFTLSLFECGMDALKAWHDVCRSHCQLFGKPSMVSDSGNTIFATVFPTNSHPPYNAFSGKFIRNLGGKSWINFPWYETLLFPLPTSWNNTHFSACRDDITRSKY